MAARVERQQLNLVRSTESSPKRTSSFSCRRMGTFLNRIRFRCGISSRSRSTSRSNASGSFSAICASTDANPSPSASTFGGLAPTVTTPRSVPQEILRSPRASRVYSQSQWRSSTNISRGSGLIAARIARFTACSTLVFPLALGPTTTVNRSRSICILRRFLKFSMATEWIMPASLRLGILPSHPCSVRIPTDRLLGQRFPTHEDMIRRLASHNQPGFLQQHLGRGQPQIGARLATVRGQHYFERHGRQSTQMETGVPDNDSRPGVFNL
jgi:hypothetical protein